MAILFPPGLSLCIFLSFIFILLRYNLKPEQCRGPWVFPLPVIHCSYFKWLFPCRAMPLAARPAPTAGPVPSQEAWRGDDGLEGGGSTQSPVPLFPVPPSAWRPASPIPAIPGTAARSPSPLPRLTASSPAPRRSPCPPAALSPPVSPPVRSPSFSQ